MFFNQHEYDVRCEWGEAGLMQLLPGSDALAIIDVLSFSTCVDIAVGNGAIIYPYQWKDETAFAYAKSVDAILASFDRKFDTGYSLSPTSLLNIPAGTRLVLPSPNGSALTLAAGQVPTVAGCLRNAAAVAQALQKIGRRISVIPAGEKWEDGRLRVAVEDLIGAGAIIDQLSGSRSPEAELAVATFIHFRRDIVSGMTQCGSGKELIGRGFGKDVELAAAMNVSACAPRFTNGAYRSF